jgi:LPS O-antigen subunit length determinant protein (WzzB/FepE family)
MKKKMLARVKTNYLLEPLDLPYIPEERTSPRRTFIVLIGTMVGFFIGIMLNLASFYGLNRVNIFNLDD